MGRKYRREEGERGGDAVREWRRQRRRSRRKRRVDEHEIEQGE